MILEIAILWYVIYMLLLFVKGTRTAQLLKGLVLIGIIFVMAQQLGLDTINWALTRLFPISVIALVIIFQPELRRGLAQLGQFGIHQENIEVIDEIVKAAVNMSRKKIGALIVIERETGLKNYIESGIPIDSKVTHYIFESIFIPSSPLHDGAAIIQHGKLIAAGCVLPLPQEEKGFARSFGMRHRAAVGITEETDAVSVAISEETGAMSVANNGRLIQHLDEEGLSKTLKNILHKPSRKKISFKAIVSWMTSKMPHDKRS